MNKFHVAGVWDEVVAGFDPRSPVSKTVEEENPEDRLWFILMSIF